MAHEKQSTRMVWREGMTFDGTTTTGHQITVDASKAAGGEDRGPKPVELLLTALAGCTAMDVLSILQKKKEPVTGLEIDVEGARAEEHPRVYTDIEVVYRVHGNVRPQSVERAIELSQTTYCSVSAMLSQTAHITTRYEIQASDGESGKERRSEADSPRHRTHSAPPRSP